MKSRARSVLVAIAGLSLGACRQADGPLPAPNQAVQEELVDVTRDLLNVAASSDPQAPKDLADDLQKYVERPGAEPAVNELSQRTAAVLTGVKLTEQDAQRLSHTLWLSVAARELSERQIETLQNDLEALLVSVGVAQENAQEVAARVGDVQGVVTSRPRRWYELF